MDDTKLLAKLKERGPSALAAQRQLYDHFAPQFFAYLRRRGVPEDDRQDIVQEAFLKALTSVDELLASSNPKSYFWSILVRLRHDWFRRRFRRLPAGTDANGQPKFRYLLKESLGSEIEVEGQAWFDLADADDPTDEPFERVADRDLRACFDRASQAFLKTYPGRAEFIELHVVAQLSNGEIAEAIGRTEHATRQFLSQCRKIFVEVLQRMCGSDAMLEGSQ